MRAAVAAFRLVVIVANDGDEVDDPTVAWPAERERVEVGRLELTGPETEREQGDDILVFDPTRVTDGIGLSDDQILRFRPRAYAASVTRRSGAPAPASALRPLAPANGGVEVAPRTTALRSSIGS